MKKKILLTLLVASAMSLALPACDSTKPSGDQPTQSTTPVAQKFTVAFEVDGVRYKTLKVEEGKTITEAIANPSKEGYKFEGWYEGDALIDLETYVVTKNVTFVAHFIENTDPVLNVDDVKDTEKSYSVVLGWWEVDDPAQPDKVTSGLTRDIVRMFYANVIKMLKASGSSDEVIDAISFRNYSSDTVLNMGNAVNADGDVGVMIGVGANIFTTAGVLPFDTTDNSKHQTVMGASGQSRYVALVKDANELAQSIYNWTKTDLGKQAFLKELSDDEIAQSLVPETLNLTVRVHGDTTETTVLTDKDTAVTMPTITTPEGKLYKGLATSEGGEVVLTKTSLKYDDLKPLAGEADELDLYPVFEDAPVVTDDLVVYVQTSDTNLPVAEAELLETRFNATLTDEKVKFVFKTENAATFTTSVAADPTVDVVVGGNTPIKDFAAAEGGATANAGALHFKNTSRKVAILASSSAAHAELAKKFYTFVTSDAPAYELYAGIWAKSDNSWVSEAEQATVKAGVKAQVASHMGVADDAALLSTYNVTVTVENVVASSDKVADYGVATRALRDGKGVDLIIGCGANVETGAGMTVVEKKAAPTSILANNRYVALVKEGGLARDVYENYFAEPAASEVTE